MPKAQPEPIQINLQNKKSAVLQRLAKAHSEFDEQFLQELLVDHPGLLPVQNLRSDIGSLVCIGREVSAGDSGSIDNLYLSTGGYPVIVETKLWRNPQARREVLSQVLDYTKEVAKKDYDWFEHQWSNFSSQKLGDTNKLFDFISHFSAEEFSEHEFIDRVNLALDRGDIISLIVGDGIESRLQALVSHLCRDSAHLRYSLALIELACYGMEDTNELIIFPRIVREVEPIQRAYVKIEVAKEIEKKIVIEPIIEEKHSGGMARHRVTLNEEEFIRTIEETIGTELRKKIELFYNELIEAYELEPEFKSAAMMLKVPDPLGEKPGVSVIGLEKEGRIYNTRHMLNQLNRAGVDSDRSNFITSEYWKQLNQIDPGFSPDGAIHTQSSKFVLITTIVDKLDQIKEEIGKAVVIVRNELEKRVE